MKILFWMGTVLLGCLMALAGCQSFLPVMTQEDLDASLDKAAAKYGWTAEEKEQFRETVEANTWSPEEAEEQIAIMAHQAGQAAATLITPALGPFAGLTTGDLISGAVYTLLGGGTIVGGTKGVKRLYVKACNSEPGKLLGPYNGGKVKPKAKKA